MLNCLRDLDGTSRLKESNDSVRFVDGEESFDLMRVLVCIDRMDRY